MSDAFSSRLAEQIALRGYGAVQASHPLLENALSQCASLSASPDTVRRLASECGAEKKKSPELFEGAVEVKDGRTCVFYRGDGSFYSSSDEFDELHKSQRECFKELVAMGLNVAQSLGLTSFDGVSVEELMQPENSYTSLAYQISPSNALVPRHIDAAALTLVVLPPEDTQLQLLPDGISCVAPSDPLSSRSLRRPTESTVKVVAFPGQLVSLDGQSNLYPVPHFVRASQVPRSSLVLRLYPTFTSTRPFPRFPSPSPSAKIIKTTSPISSGPLLYLKSLTQTITELRCHLDATVLTLKNKYSDMHGMPAEDFRLIFGGITLEHEKRLSDYNVQEESTLHVVQRIRGD
eukprot:GILI01020429.1.p1 GENE.GILI01020429.1~~GILI01020429.1.p1  ORF type:complete len:377 (+),score=47.16 GILI01020429.1:88-1131(+)